jgi:hypothetical protein
VNVIDESDTMAILTCEKCGKQSAKISTCNYCNKKICFACVKSSKKLLKVKDIFICKTCWGSMKSRGKFKSA